MKNSHLWAGVAAVAGFALIMAACSKNDNGPNMTVNETRLAAHTWYVNAVSMSTINMTGTGGTAGDTTSTGTSTTVTTGTGTTTTATATGTAGTGTTGTGTATTTTTTTTGTGSDTTGAGTGTMTTSYYTGNFTDSSFYTSCMHDDNVVFKSNHQFTFSNANTSCDSTILPYGSGTWSFNSAEDTLRLKTGGSTMNWQVVSLNDSTLGVSYADSARNVTTQLTFTSHQ
jgi:hypothetical protein